MTKILLIIIKNPRFNSDHKKNKLFFITGRYPNRRNCISVTPGEATLWIWIKNNFTIRISYVCVKCSRNNLLEVQNKTVSEFSEEITPW